MSGVDEEQIPAGTARTFHPGCVGGAGVELCGRLLAEFIAPGQLEPLLPCNFSWSNLMCLGMWLQSALRNTSLSMVTLIPPFLFSPVKNKEERNLAFIGRVFCLCHLSLGGLHPHWAASVGSLSRSICPGIRIARSGKDVGISALYFGSAQLSWVRRQVSLLHPPRREGEMMALDTSQL